MPDTLTATDADAAPVPGCTCCKPPAVSVDDQIAELRRREEAVERRLRDLTLQ